MTTKVISLVFLEHKALEPKFQEAKYKIAHKHNKPLEVLSIYLRNSHCTVETLLLMEFVSIGHIMAAKIDTFSNLI